MPRFPNISHRGDTLSDSIYSTLVERTRAAKKRIFPLHVGDTYREPLMQARAEFQLSREHPALHAYSATQGDPELIDALIENVYKRQEVRIDREALQVMAGATAGLNIIAEVLIEPGDEVLLLSPYWPLSRGIFATKGANIIEIPFFTHPKR